MSKPSGTFSSGDFPLGPLSLCWGTAESVPLLEMIDAAAESGYPAITISPAYYVRAIENGLSDEVLAGLLKEKQLQVTGIDPVLSWLPGAMRLDSDDDFGIATRTSVAEALRIAKVTGAPLINLSKGFGEPVTHQQIVDSFATACELAALQGKQVTLEFTPFSDISSLTAAWDIVREAGCTNGGLMLDSWHFFQTGGDLSELDAIPAGKIFAVQVNGVNPVGPDQWIDHALNHRLLPGEGSADVAGLLRHLQAKGVSAPLDVEVFSESLRQLPVLERAEKTLAATQSLVAGLR